jgi:hypothetical protein
MTSQAWTWRADRLEPAGQELSNPRGVGSHFETDLGLRPHLGPILITHSTMIHESVQGGAGLT